MNLKKSEVASIFLAFIMVAFALVSLNISKSYQAVSQPVFAEVKETLEPSDQTALININTASKEELCLLPNIGPKLAEKIIAFRNEHGPFAVKSDILDVSGIGIKTYNKLSDLITS